MKSDGLVNSANEARANVKTLARYGCGTLEERAFHNGRIKNGKNFIAMEYEGEWIFAPSKFAGYADNDTSHITKLASRDGGITNQRLTELFGEPLVAGASGFSEVDARYQDYAAKFLIPPSKHARGRKFWLA